jgi:hypothetical protein
MSLRDSWAWREALMIAKLALLATALFAGASIYITFVEHPARMLCPIPWAVAQWRPSYKRATLMQASLAVIGSLAAVSAWLAGAGLAWLVAGLLLGAVVPFTLIVISPTNKRLEDHGLDPSSEGARILLTHWGHLHAVRSGASLLALILMLGAI